jgi:hypothetical protein
MRARLRTLRVAELPPAASATMAAHPEWVEKPIAAVCAAMGFHQHALSENSVV